MNQEQHPDRWTVRDQILVAVSIVLGLLIMVIVICGYAFGWEWSGLPNRTFWDWLKLLIVPVVLAIGGYLFTRSENRRTQQIEEQGAQETALQAYLEQLTQLVRDGLPKEEPLGPLRLLARGRTLSLLWQLDPNRKRALLQILHEAGLIKNEEYPIIGLSGADLRGAYLRELNLKEAKLDGADLKGAALSGACLRGADLGGADLSVYDETEKAAELTGADLSDVNLTHAKVTKVQLGSCRSLAGATMPDGQKYEDWLKSEGRGEDGKNSGPS